MKPIYYSRGKYFLQYLQFGWQRGYQTSVPLLGWKFFYLSVSLISNEEVRKCLILNYLGRTLKR